MLANDDWKKLLLEANNRLGKIISERVTDSQRGANLLVTVFVCLKVFPFSLKFGIPAMFELLGKFPQTENCVRSGLDRLPQKSGLPTFLLKQIRLLQDVVYGTAL